MESVLLILRGVLALAAVLALLWWIARRVNRIAPSTGKQGIAVLSRQQMSRHSGVALIEVSGQRLVVGYSDTGVTLVHDAGPAPRLPEADFAEEFDKATLNAGEHQPTLDGALHWGDSTRASAHNHARDVSDRKSDASQQSSPLDGSILAPSTWRKAWALLLDRINRGR